MSQIMEKVLEAEKACDERVRAARAEALETSAQADVRAERIISLAKQRAAEKSRETIAQANAEAEKILSQGKHSSDEAAAALKKEADAKFDAASKAVASMLLKIS